jgi:CubicO group peptidase (beta-lactamase class C family)
MRAPGLSLSPHQVDVRPSQPARWPEASRALAAEVVGAGRVLTLDEFLVTTSTTALVVVVDDVLVHERYFDGTAVDDGRLGNSATKSVLALLTGLAVGRRRIPSIDVPVCDFVPELVGSGYQHVTVRQVLTMTSGVAWEEDYRDPRGAASTLLARWRTGAGGSRELLRGIGAGAPPGTRFAYCSPDSMVLDWVRERATGQTFADALAELWQRTGAEQPAKIGLDASLEDGGVAVAAGALVATARDWARIGTLQLDGCWRDDQVLDRAWVDASSRPEKPFLVPGRLPSTITTHAGFGYHWWPLNAEGSRVMADGMRGQFVYVDRSRRTVVVKTSAWPYDDPWWDRQCRDLCYLALPAIADAAAEVA